MVIFVTLTRPWRDRKTHLRTKTAFSDQLAPCCAVGGFSGTKKIGPAAVFSHTLFISFFSSPSPAHLDLLVSPFMARSTTLMMALCLALCLALAAAGE
jgi:hypothetical protein